MDFWITNDNVVDLQKKEKNQKKWKKTKKTKKKETKQKKNKKNKKKIETHDAVSIYLNFGDANSKNKDLLILRSKFINYLF